MDFYWSLSDSKSSQVSRTLLNILVDLNNAVVWMFSSRSAMGREKRVGWTKELLGVGNGTRTRAVDTGHQSRKASRHKIGSSDREEDRVKMSRHSSCFVEFSLVTYASVSLYMLSEMQCDITPCLAL